MTDLKEIGRILDRAFLMHQAGDYAELVDEDDPQGLVRICGKNGRLKVIMERSLWDELRVRVAYDHRNLWSGR